MSAQLNQADFDRALAEDLVRFTHDPHGYVMWSFPWGQGELAGKTPHPWQVEILQYLRDQLTLGAITVQEAIQIAVASGHGIGKSALVCWVIKWAIDTAVDTRGVVTANTETQLKTKTWAELSKWHRLSITKHLFKYTATALFSLDPDHEKTWRIDMIPWSENNTEAFAGMHNAGKRILLIFDEASAIPDSIWEVAEGALTDEDTEIMWIAFGNPTRNQGRFFECFNKFKHRWRTQQIDSRTVPGTNKTQIQKWIDDYGEDDDFVRIRVRGIFPRASVMQFIGLDLLEGAMARVMEYERPNTAVLGVDVARFGDDDSVIRTRIGRDMRSFAPIYIHGMSTTQVASVVAEHINHLRSLGLRVVTFIDGGATGGGVIDILNDLGYEVIEVPFGGDADNKKMYSNKRAEMYGRFKSWLSVGYLDDNTRLKTETTAVMYSFQQDRYQLERKEVLKSREGFSPDDADACALTFAYPVPEQKDAVPTPTATRTAQARRNHDPYARMGQSGRTRARLRRRTQQQPKRITRCATRSA